ncbi:MAG: stage II sporulation protein M, partial [Jatrophihabitans sp.]
MDLDAFLLAHQPGWTRLERLASQRHLDAREADELVALYRSTARHLALVQSRAPDPALLTRLSILLTRARAAAVGAPRRRGWSALA